MKAAALYYAPMICKLVEKPYFENANSGQYGEEVSTIEVYSTSNIRDIFPVRIRVICHPDKPWDNSFVHQLNDSLKKC